MNTASSCQRQSFSEMNFCWALLSKKKTVDKKGKTK